MKDDQLRAISLAVGTFSNNADYVIEFLQKNQTTKAQLEFVVNPYNEAVDSLTNREYVYRAAIRSCWGSALPLYDSYFSDVRTVDKAVHAFNDEFLKVATGAEQKADPERIRPLTAAASDAASRLHKSGRALMDALSNSEDTER